MSISRSVPRLVPLGVAAGAAVMFAGAAGLAGMSPAGAAVHPASSAVRPAAGVAACRGGQVQVSHSVPQGAMGTAALVLRFRNISRSACSLYGYPGLDALRKNGTVLAHAARVKDGSVGGTRTIRTIVVRPDQLASASVQWHTFNPATGGACAWSARIAATPANTATTTVFPVSVARCGLQIHPTVAGGGGGIGVH